MAISGVKSGYISVKKAAVSIQYRLSIVKGGQKLNVENFGGGGGGGDIGLVSSAHQLPRGVWGHAPPGIFLGI